MKFNCPKIKRILVSGPIAIYYALYFNCFYAQLASFCYSEKLLLCSR